MDEELRSCPKCQKQMGEDFDYCPYCGFHLLSDLDAIQLSRLFGAIDANSPWIHKLAQGKLQEMGERKGFRVTLEYEAPNLVTAGRTSFVDAVWFAGNIMVAAFEVRMKKHDLEIVRTEKDIRKLERLQAKDKFIVNVSEMTGKAYFHKLPDTWKMDQSPNVSPGVFKAYTVEGIRSSFPRAYEKWSQEEDRTLVNEYNTGASIVNLAKAHRRQPGAIRSRLAKLGSISPQAQSTTG